MFFRVCKNAWKLTSRLRGRTPRPGGRSWRLGSGASLQWTEMMWGLRRSSAARGVAGAIHDHVGRIEVHLEVWPVHVMDEGEQGFCGLLAGLEDEALFANCAVVRRGAG